MAEESQLLPTSHELACDSSSTRVDDSTHQLDALVVVPHLGAGGTQRVVTLLLDHWCEAGWRIGILTLFATPDSYPLHSRVYREDFMVAADGLETHPLRQVNRRIEAALAHFSDRGSPLRSALVLPLLAAFRALRQSVVTAVTAVSPNLAERFVRGKREVRWLRSRFSALHPRVVVSFLGATNIQTVLAAEGLKVPVLISERNDPAIQHLGQPWQTLRKRVYARADMVTANSLGALETLSRWVAPERLSRVHNPLAMPPPPSAMDRSTERLVLVARLVPQKGVDLLIDAFARVAGELGRWQLDLVGDGPLRTTLMERAQRFGLSDRIVFHGHQSDPFPYLYRASIFVLPSRFEGMPNALLEAMGAGLAIIVTDASPGPLEFITNGETGIVVPADNAGALATAIYTLCMDAALRVRLATASQGLAASMALPSVASQWETIISNTIANRGPSQKSAVNA